MKQGDIINFKFNVGRMYYSGAGKVVSIENEIITVNAGGQDLKILKEHIF